MEVFSGFLSGGTSFEEPLKSALSVIEKHKAYKKSDIVFITDGESAINDVFKDHINAVKDKRKISILTVLIGPDAHGVECFSVTFTALKLSIQRTARKFCQFSLLHRDCQKEGVS